MNHTDGIDSELQEILRKTARETTLAEKASTYARTREAVEDASKRYEWSIGEALQAIKALFLKDLQELMGQKETVYRPKTYTVVYNQDGDTEKREGMEFTDAIPLSAVEALIEKYRSEK